jgi:hypothetical protein
VGSGHFSYFAYGPATSLQTIFVADDIIVPDPGASKIRFVNFCAGAPAIACYFNGSKVDSPVTYGAVDQFIQVTAASGLLYVKDPAHPAHTASIPTQSFLTSKLYTVILTDTSAADTSGLELTVINNY